MLFDICKDTHIHLKSLYLVFGRYYHYPRFILSLMYDLDAPSVLSRLQKIPGAILLCSNPCIELWLLLHYTDQRAEIGSADCVSKLSGYIKQYKKGKLSIEDKLSLMDNVTIASKRAQKLSSYKNPSTTIYELIEELDKLKGKN